MTDRITILEIIAGFSIEKPLGGIERFVVELSRNLDPDRFQVTVFGLWDFDTPYGDNWIKTLEQAGVIAVEGGLWNPSQPYKNFWQSLKQLDSYVGQHHAQIIHSHDQFGNIMAVYMRRHDSRMKLVRTLHNHREWGRKPLRRLLLRDIIYPLAYDVEIGLNQQMVASLNQRLFARVLKKPAQLIHNAVNLTRFETNQGNAQAIKESLGIPAGCRVVGSVGRLTEQKGYNDFLAAAAIVLKMQPDTFFVLVGSGELEENLREKVLQLGINDHFIFAGTRTDIEKFISIFDLFVSSSWWEGFPTVILESMAAGIPVLATKIPGNVDLIEDGISGLLCAVHNPASLADGIRQALNNPLLCKKLAVQAQKAVRRFSIAQITHEYEQLFIGLTG